MLAGMDAYLTRAISASVELRQQHWAQDFSSHDAYIRSIERNRGRLRKILGVVDPRIPIREIEYVGSTATPSLVAKTDGYSVYSVRWAVLPGVNGEGLLLEPNGPPVGRVVALPDADWSPEQLVGLAPGVPRESQFARRLAENGFQVLVPVLIDRQDTWSGSDEVRYTNQTHREFIYRAAFQMGRHIVGYEVQKILAAVDWFLHDAGCEDPKVAVIGYGEGGLLALYAAAVDRRIDAAVVSGYFQQREAIWREPIYRNVWSLLREFGDAELAALIAPRVLVIDASLGPEREGPPPHRKGREGAAPGKLVSPPLGSVRREINRAEPVFANLSVPQNLRFVVSDEGRGPAASDRTLREFADALGVQMTLQPLGSQPQDARPDFDPDPRQRRQFDQLNEFTQKLVRQSERIRNQFWSRADTSSLERFIETSKFYRDYLHEEVIGKLPPPNVPTNARTRLVYDEATWKGYEVMLDVYPDVIASGVLLVPNGIESGERRPVVVCQHGSGDSAHDPIRPQGRAFRVYKAFAAQLAERGFVVYSPQNPYGLVRPFQELQRKANPLGVSSFSLMIRQHECTLDWLGSLPFVDAKRIGFYGLSFGGKTAMRVPPILMDRYALSICSADFTEWILKTASTSHRPSYMFTEGYSIYEFDLGNTFNYAELAYLMIPRPFMVERGHRDGVGPDHWVGYEYAKVRRMYTLLGIGDRTDIEWFDGPHCIHGVGTFEFLHKHLKWPPP